MSTGDLVTRVYQSFRGVDFRGEEVNLVRSPDSLNIWKDYGETESISTRPDMELLESFEQTVWGIFFYAVDSREILLVHSGTKLYGVEDGVKKVLYTELNPRQSSAFVYNNIWYFKDGIHYLQYDGETIGEVVGYIPTTTIGRKPAGGGTLYEDVNMLTGYRINTFLADGKSTEYYLDTEDIDADVVPLVFVNDSMLAVSEYEVNSAKGKITFHTAPEAPLTDGQDNVRVKFRRTVPGYRERINQCTLLQVFDNRVFFSGNKDYPNTLWHCSLHDPTYCSDTDYYNEGLDMARVTGLVAGNNALWVMKEPSQANTAVFYHNPTIDSEYGKVYPSTHSSVSTGCVGKAVNFNDDIVFFSDRGMEAINGDITTEQVLAHRSTLIDRKLISEETYRDMLLEEWEGYLMVFVGNHVYLADSRAQFVNGNHYEYEWFYWEFGKEVTCTCVKDGVLYLGTEDGVYTLTNQEAPVKSYWTTPADRFDNPNMLKTSNKRGCVAEAVGDVTVYVKTESTGWELIEEYKDITDYFVSRIKRKKFKDIQLKFYSDTRFSLEAVTLECFIGGYLKR